MYHDANLKFIRTEVHLVERGFKGGNEDKIVAGKKKKFE